MKNCPYCNSPLQENALFCLYCMRELSEKKEISQKKKRKNKIVFAVIAVIAAIGAAIGCYFAFFRGGPEENAENEQMQTGGDTGAVGSEDQTDTGSDGDDWEIISTFEDFELRFIYLTGKGSFSGLWDAGGFTNTHANKDQSGDAWEVYATDTNIPGVNFSISFCEDGEEIITAVTGITDKTYEDSMVLLQCAVYSVYNYTYTNLYDFLTDRDKYPMEGVEDEESFLDAANLPDAAQKKIDSGTVATLEYAVSKLDNSADGEDHLLCYELRTRTYMGETVYDIFLLHTRDR